MTIFLFYLNILVHLGVLVFVFSLFSKWKKKDFKKPLTQDNWLKLTILTIAIVPFTFVYGFIETTSPSIEYLTQGEIEWCGERNIKLKDCEQSWPLR